MRLLEGRCLPGTEFSASERTRTDVGTLRRYCFFWLTGHKLHVNMKSKRRGHRLSRHLKKEAKRAEYWAVRGRIYILSLFLKKEYHMRHIRGRPYERSS